MSEGVAKHLSTRLKRSLSEVRNVALLDRFHHRHQGTTATVTTLTPSATSVSTGGAVTLTAAVSPAAATGTVTFYDGATSLGTATLSSGSAALAATFATAGTQSLTAVYAGSATYAASTSAAVSVTVAASASACTATLEGEEGPYFVDDSATGYLRSNILSNLDGSNTPDRRASDPHHLRLRQQE